jgi:signal transduction histidine kinase
VVGLRWSDDELQIEVRDDGKGFRVNPPEQPMSGEMSGDNDSPAGIGLSTIRHQLSLFGGRMEIQSTLGAGARIVLSLPLTESE